MKSIKEHTQKEDNDKLSSYKNQLDEYKDKIISLKLKTRKAARPSRIASQ